jgi:phosphoesterase RecJ-like protein
MGLALLKSKLHLDGKCISSVITAGEMKEYDVLPKHLDGIVNQLRVTKDVEVAIFLYETGDGTFKVSTRSASYVDLASIASKFGGGGHMRAAGFSMTGEAETIIETIVAEVAKQI